MASRTAAPPPPPIASGPDSRPPGNEPPAPVIDAAGNVEIDVAPGEPAAGSAVDQGVEALQTQLAEANRQREAAEARARDAEARARGSERVAIDSTAQVIETAIANEGTNKKSIISKIKAAKEAGDYDAETAAQDELNQVNIRINDLNKGKLEYKRRTDEQAEMANLNPVEQAVRGLTPPSAQWVRAHPDFVTDPAKNAKMMAAHYDAIGAGVRGDTPEYFEHIETFLGLRQGAVEIDVAPPPPPRNNGRQAPPPPSAPVSRGSPEAQILPQGISRTSTGTYKLTPELAQFAITIGMTPEEYLKYALEIQKEGGFARTTH